jgi:hypothetical protein
MSRRSGAASEVMSIVPAGAVVEVDRRVAVVDLGVSELGTAMTVCPAVRQDLFAPAEVSELGPMRPRSDHLDYGADVTAGSCSVSVVMEASTLPGATGYCGQIGQSRDGAILQDPRSELRHGAMVPVRTLSVSTRIRRRYGWRRNGE